MSYGLIHNIPFADLKLIPPKYIMTTTPQAVTERYISNLITNGRNREFDIETILMQEHVVDSTTVGTYYTTRILAKSSAEQGVGATISQAVRNALIKHGVTFR